MPGRSGVRVTFVLKIAVYLLNILEIKEVQVNQEIRMLIQVVSDDQGAVESIVTEKLQFLSIVVPSQRLFRTLHVEDVQN
jgi:hypothetical protein